MTDLDVSESCVYRTNFIPEQASEKIELILQRYHSQGYLPMWWIVGPSSQPDDLENSLGRGDFDIFAHPPGMIASCKTWISKQPCLTVLLLSASRIPLN